MGRVLIIAGICITIIGVVLHFFPGALRWFGSLPGDIKVEKKNISIYFPIVSMLLLSIILSLISCFIKR